MSQGYVVHSDRRWCGRCDGRHSRLNEPKGGRRNTLEHRAVGGRRMERLVIEVRDLVDPYDRGTTAQRGGGPDGPSGRASGRARPTSPSIDPPLAPHHGAVGNEWMGVAVIEVRDLINPYDRGTTAQRGAVRQPQQHPSSRQRPTSPSIDPPLTPTMVLSAMSGWALLSLKLRDLVDPYDRGTTAQRGAVRQPQAARRLRRTRPTSPSMDPPFTPTMVLSAIESMGVAVIEIRRAR